MAAIPSKLDQLPELRRLYGTQTAVRWIGYRTVRRVVGLNVAHVVWLDGANLDGSLRADPAYTFRFLSADEVRALAGNPQNWLNPLWADRIAAGSDFCFAALAGPRLAAFTWYALGGLVAEHCAGTALSYPPGVAYMYHGFTRPELRGKRLHGMVMGLGLRALGTSGVSRIVATIDGANRASLRSCFRLGFVSLGRAVVFTFGRFRAGFYPRAAKRLGIRFGKNALCGVPRTAGGRLSCVLLWASASSAGDDAGAPPDAARARRVLRSAERIKRRSQRPPTALGGGPAAEPPRP